MNINTGMDETNDMVRAFIKENIIICFKGQSTMMGSQIYINLMEYVKKICDENNFNTIDIGETEEDIIDVIRSQMEYDFNALERGSGFMMEEKLDYFSIKWLENAYEYHKWECGFGCNVEAQLESKVNFMMYCIAKEYCEKWIEKEDLDSSLF